MTIYIVRLCMYEIYISLKANECPIAARRSWKRSSTGNERSLKSASRLDEGIGSALTRLRRLFLE